MNTVIDRLEQVDWQLLVRLNRDRLRFLMGREGIEALVVCSLDNWRYVTGLPAPYQPHTILSQMAVLLVSSDLPIVLLGEAWSPWIREKAAAEIEPIWIDTPVVEQVFPPYPGAMMDRVRSIIGQHVPSGGLVALDPAMPFVFHDRLTGSGHRLVNGYSLLTEARLIKNREEIKAIRQACSVADIAMEAALGAIREGVREIEIAAVIDQVFREQGAEYAPSVMVLSGEHAYLYYLFPTNRVILNGELVRVDIGCSVGGYASDFSRSSMVGEPADVVVSAYQAVHKALQAGIDIIRPGTATDEIEDICNQTLKEASNGRYSAGFLGHGLGLGLHEIPILDAAERPAPMVLAEGMYLCIEPAVYIPGYGAIGLEDDILVGRNGPEVLTHTPFSL